MFKAAWRYLNKDVREVVADVREAGKALMVAGGVGVAAIVASVPAPVQAAVPDTVEPAFTEMAADFGVIFGFAFAVLVTVTIAMIAWRYTRKLGNRI